MGCAVINYARPPADARCIYGRCVWLSAIAHTPHSRGCRKTIDTLTHKHHREVRRTNKHNQTFGEKILFRGRFWACFVFIVINSGVGIFLSVELMRPLRVRQPRQIVSLSAAVLRVAHAKKVSGLLGRFIGLCAGGAMNVFACAAFSVGQTSGACEWPGLCAETIPRTHATSRG